MVSVFAGPEKKSTWNTWNLLPEFTGVLLTLSHAFSDIPEEARQTINWSFLCMTEPA